MARGRKALKFQPIAGAADVLKRLQQQQASFNPSSTDDLTSMPPPPVPSSSRIIHSTAEPDTPPPHPGSISYDTPSAIPELDHNLEMSPLSSPFTPITPRDSEPPISRRPYKHIVIPEVPETPEYMVPFTPHTPSPYVIPTVPENPECMQALGLPLPQRFNNEDPAPWPRLRAARSEQSNGDDLFSAADNVLDMIHEKFGHGGIGKFLDVILTCRDDQRRTIPLRNWSMVQRWLQGRTSVRAFDNVKKMYDHKYSYPTSKASLKSEREYHFSPFAELGSLHYTRILISSWATRVVGNRLYKDIGDLTKDIGRDTYGFDSDRDLTSRLRASTLNSKDVMEFDMKSYIQQLKERAPTVWFITECMAASRYKGVTIVKKMRPHPLVSPLFLCSTLSNLIYRYKLQLYLRLLSQEIVALLGTFPSCLEYFILHANLMLV